jgi:hypothetical protein
MNARQRWCIWLGLLASIALYLVPPWRYRIATELQGPDYITLTGREAHPYGLRSSPPQYHRKWQRGAETGTEHSEDQEIDDLRLVLSLLTVATIVIILARQPHCQAPSAFLRHATIVVMAGAAKWALIDTALVLIRPQVELYFLVAPLNERMSLAAESILASSVRLGLIR